MLPHTQAFKRLKTEAQQIFDFAIVVSYAVPALKHSLKKLDPNEPPPFRPDFFNSRPVKTEKVQAHSREYKGLLARYIFLSSFSFFEAYFHDILKEIVEFHGKEHLLEKTPILSNTKLASDAEAREARRKLQEYRKLSNKDRYASNATKLTISGYRLPSTLLSRYGLQKIVELVEKEYIAPGEIPNLIRDLLQLDLDPESEVRRFHAYRATRNKIAHGRPRTPSLREAIEMNDFLRQLALRVDKHVLEHYLLVEL